MLPVFQYQLPQPAEVIPQGNILVSVDLNKGKSDNAAVLNLLDHIQQIFKTRSLMIIMFMLHLLVFLTIILVLSQISTFTRNQRKLK